MQPDSTKNSIVASLQQLDTELVHGMSVSVMQIIAEYAMGRIFACSTDKCDETVLVYDSDNLDKKYGKKFGIYIGSDTKKSPKDRRYKCAKYDMVPIINVNADMSNNININCETDEHVHHKVEQKEKNNIQNKDNELSEEKKNNKDNNNAGNYNTSDGYKIEGLQCSICTNKMIGTIKDIVSKQKFGNVLRTKMVIDQYANIGNNNCADCGVPRVSKWVSLGWDTYICYSCTMQTMIVQKSVDDKNLTIRHLSLDAWRDEDDERTAAVMKFLSNGGNFRQNAKYEAKMRRNINISGTSINIKPNGRDATDQQRKIFIQKKYVDRVWYSDVPCKILASDTNLLDICHYDSDNDQ